MLYLTVPTGFYPRSRLSRESGRSPVILSSFFLPINPCYYSTVHMCPFQNSFVQITYPTWDCHCCRWFQTAKFLLLSYSLSLWCFSFFCLVLRWLGKYTIFDPTDLVRVRLIPFTMYYYCRRRYSASQHWPKPVNVDDHVDLTSSWDPWSVVRPWLPRGSRC